MSKKIRMQRIAVIIAIVTATVILPVAAQAQTKDDFEYWDLNGNSDLTCTEASGKGRRIEAPGLSRQPGRNRPDLRMAATSKV